jgi:hypothetical protein
LPSFILKSSSPLWRFAPRRAVAQDPKAVQRDAHFLAAAPWLTALSSFPQKLRHGFRAGADVKLFIDAADVIPDGVNAHVDLVGDLFVVEPVGQIIRPIPFSGRNG